MNTRPEPTTRAATPEDEPFLRRVFQSARTELTDLPLDGPAADLLVDMQHRAQKQHYSQTFPDAKTSIILADGAAAGYIICHEGAEIRILDIALSPEFCNQGIGSAILKALCTQAHHQNKPVTLTVRPTNPAANLYHRLGFREVASNGMDCEMVCSPST